MQESIETSPGPIHIASGSCLRLARASDNPAILKLFNATPMNGSLVVSTDRAPSFFSLYQMQDATTECWVTERQGELVGCATFIIRPAWLNGKPAKVGYLGDLRYSLRGFGILTKFYARVLHEVQQRHGVALFYTGIMDSNTAARKALVERKGARKRQPAYHELRSYDAVNIRFTPFRPRIPRGWQVRRATALDLPTIIDFLHQDHKHRPFGYRFDQGELQHRLHHWPGFALDNTYLAYSNHELQSLCTLWDAHAVKRYQVHAYKGGMKWLYRSTKLASRMFEIPALPAPGENFRYAYLANCSVRNQDPTALQALLAKVMQDARSSNYHFLMAYVEHNTPLQQALRSFSVQRTPFKLYEVTAPDADATKLRSTMTGFEIALA